MPIGLTLTPTALVFPLRSSARLWADTVAVEGCLKCASRTLGNRRGSGEVHVDFDRIGAAVQCEDSTARDGISIARDCRERRNNLVDSRPARAFLAGLG